MPPDVWALEVLCGGRTIASGPICSVSGRCVLAGQEAPCGVVEEPVCGNLICEPGELFDCISDCTDFWIDLVVFLLIIILLIILIILLYVYKRETVLLYVYRSMRGT